MLINAFKSTLEEATRADLLLNVCDASDENVASHIATTEATLSELGATAPLIRVYNKCDKLEENSAISLDTDSVVSSVFISALTGKNIDVLMEAVKKHVNARYSTVKLRVPLAESAKLLSLLHKLGAQCQSVEYLDEYAEMRTVISKKYVDLVAQYIVF